MIVVVSHDCFPAMAWCGIVSCEGGFVSVRHFAGIAVEGLACNSIGMNGLHCRFLLFAVPTLSFKIFVGGIRTQIA